MKDAATPREAVSICAMKPNEALTASAAVLTVTKPRVNSDNVPTRPLTDWPAFRQPSEDSLIDLLKLRVSPVADLRPVTKPSLLRTSVTWISFCPCPML